MNKIKQIYTKLLKDYGHQGWWPLLNHKGTNPTKTGSITGYHPNNYDFPKNPSQRFEICLGAILTQNTNWINVEKALLSLRKANALDIKRLKKLSDGKLKELIKPAGYYNQKAKKLREFTDFYKKLNGKTPTREKLLNVWGIGPETADSILLYAYSQPIFVIDAYTRRIFANLQIIEEKDDYDNIRNLFEKNLDPDFKIYQEYHALIVEHAKRFYKKKELYKDCPLLKLK